MSMDRRTSNQLSQTMVNVMRSNFDYLQYLPAPEVEWRRRDAPPLVQEAFEKARAANLIEPVKKIKVQTETRSTNVVNVWRTKPQIYHAIQEYQQTPSSSPRMPCGHHGFINLRESTKYACKLPDRHCDARFTRAEVKRALEGSE